MNTVTRRVLVAGSALAAVLGVGGVAHAASMTPPPTTQTATASSHPGQSTAKSGAAQEQNASEQSSSQNSGEQTSHETDGPGGHADPAGANVNHQFNGAE